MYLHAYSDGSAQICPVKGTHPNGQLDVDDLSLVLWHPLGSGRSSGAGWLRTTGRGRVCLQRRTLPGSPEAFSDGSPQAWPAQEAKRMSSVRR